MNKVELFRSLLFAALICLLLWDGLSWMTDPVHRLPAGHKRLLLTVTVLWFMLVLSGKNRDDDWVSES